jgi:predicted metalloprotease with PDZ domain
MKDSLFRKSGRIVLLILFFALQLSLFASEKNQTVHYEWSREPAPSLASVVTIQVPVDQDTQLTFIMPGWSPGAYTFSEYAQFVEDVTARDVGGSKLTVRKLDERSWRVSVKKASQVSLSYRVNNPHRAINFSIHDSSHATVQGPSTFMYVEGRKGEPVTVRYVVPKGWEIATSLAETPEADGYVYRAPNYDVFVDSPAEIGNLEERSFTVRGVPIEVVMFGRLDFDQEAFVKMVGQIAEHQVHLFDSVPFEKYVFLFNVGAYGAGGGGLEHLNSTNISLSLPQLQDDVRSAANVTAHEFFHLWNVKRIRPAVLGPFDYTQPACTRALWFAEGVTSYYADLTQVRTGLVDEGKFLSMQRQQIVALQRNPDRLITSVEQASLKIWERGYFHSGISYYNKGQLLGLLLDLRIRRETDNRRSLDDMMRDLNENYAKRGIGYAENELATVAGKIAGADLGDFFSRYVAGVDELPFAEYLSWAGIDFQEENERFTSIGALHILGPRNRITMIDGNGPAAKAGMRRGDHLLEIDGHPIKSHADIALTVAAKRPGESVRVSIERDGRRRDYLVTTISEMRVEYDVRYSENPSEQQQRIQRGLLHGTTDAR